MIKYPRRALDKGSNAAGARSAGKAEAAGRRLVLITVRGQAREFGSRLSASCNFIQGAGKPAHADRQMCRLDGFCRDPGSRRTGGENGRREPPPRATVGQCCPARGDRRVARPFRRRALTRDVAVPESLCAHIKSPRKRLTSLRGVV